MTDAPKLRVTKEAVEAARERHGQPPWLPARVAQTILEAALPHLKPAPELPTEPGSVVLATRVDGEAFDPPLLLVLTSDEDDHPWLNPLRARALRFLRSGDIQEWIPASVVPDETGEV